MPIILAAEGIELILPDWFYSAVIDRALVLTIDRAYFALLGGLERWLYRIVRKHGGRQRGGWRFDLKHLHHKSGSLAPFKRFAFELRDIVRRQPLPGYRLALVIEHRRTLLAFSTAACGQAVDGVVLPGTPTIVPSGTALSCYPEPKTASNPRSARLPAALNLDSNTKPNIVVGARRAGDSLFATGCAS